MPFLFHSPNEQTQKKALHALLFFCFSLVFLYLLRENFLFRECHLLSERIDDHAYAAPMKQAGDYLLQGKGSLLFYSLFAYGYGWVFWFFSGLITLPFNLLNQMDWFMVAPRIASSLFVFSGCYVVYKILSLYLTRESTKATALLTILLFPALPWIAMRTGTDAAGFFFNALSFYLAASLKPLPKRREILLLAFVFALSVGIKVSALLLAPLIGLILLDRLNWQINKQTLFSLFLFGFTFLFAALFFANPAFLTNPERLSPYFDVMSYYMERVTIPLPLKDNDISGFAGRYLHGIADQTIVSFPLFVLGMGAMLWSAIKRRPRDKDLLIVFVSFLLISIYLAFHIKMGSYFIVFYIFPLSFLFLLSFCGLEDFCLAMEKKGGSYRGLSFLLPICCLIALGAIGLSNRTNIISQYTRYHSAYEAYLAQDQTERNQLKAFFDEIERKESSDYSVLADYWAAQSACPLSEKLKIFAIFDNMGILKGVFDYLIVNREAKSLDPSTNFQNIENKEIREGLIIDKKTRRAFLKTNRLNQTAYTPIKTIGPYILYRRQSSDRTPSGK